MTSGTEPLEFGRTILHRASACAQKKVTRHRRGAWLRQKKNVSTRLLSQILVCAGSLEPRRAGEAQLGKKQKASTRLLLQIPDGNEDP